MRPRPVRADADAPRTVMLRCRSYDRCLDIADRRDWDAFSCERCAAYEGVPARELVDRDHEGLLLLARAIGFGDDMFVDREHGGAAAGIGA
jgi:hypothetical protein